MKPHRLLPILVLAAVFHRASAWGQDAGQKSIFPPTSDAYQVLWRRLDGLAREESWESVLEGLRELAALHQRPEENPVVSSGAGYSVGIRRLAARFLDRMPAEQRRRHIDYADGLIEKAWEATRGRIDGADRARLRRAIVRDYPDSRFRAAALKEEIDSALLAGSWDRARLAAEELERTWSRSPTPPDVLERIQARLCLLLSQQALGTEAPWREARRSLLSLLDGEGLDPGSLPPQWRDLAQSVVDGRFPAPGAPLEKRAYSALRPDVGTRRPGAESREPGAEERSFRIGGVVWRPDEPASELRRFLSERSRSRDGAAIPRSCVPIPYHAASRGSLVVFQHDHQVMAVDLESRRQRWAFILPLALLPYNAVRSPACSAGRCYFSHGSSLYSVDLESGAPLWQRSLRYDRAERRLVLVEDDEGAPDDDDAPAAGGPPRDEPAGLDAQPRAEGDEHPPPETSGRVPVYEISPAVVVEGEIIVAATVRLDRESLVYLLRVGTTGEIVWSAYIGSAQSCGFLGLAATGSTPAVLDETVYHLSHQGFLAAADARDGTIAWILEYPVVSPQAEKEAIRDENRWHPSPVLPLPDGEILIAPQDSPLLMAVRRRDGAIVWRAERQQHSAILGCDERRCYLSGWQVSAVSIEAGSRGSLLWSRSLDETADSPLGIGLYRPGQLLVSTHRALLEIHPETGDLVRRDLWAFPGGGGNLLLAGEHLAVVHPGGCMVYNGYEAEVAHLERLPADPAETPLLQARLRLRVGDVETGLAFLESWAEAPPPAPELNSPMDRLRLELSEIIAEAAAAAEPALAARLLRARVQVEHAAWRKVEAAIQLADHLERSGDRAGAIDALYLALAADFPPTQHTVEGGGAEFRIDAATFIRDRILSLRRAEPDPAAAFAAIETKAEEQLEEAYRSGRSRMGKTSVAYLELLRRFPFTRAAAQAYLDLATFYGDYRNHENAARCLLEYLEEFPESEDRLKVLLRAADFLYRSGRRAEAKRLYLGLLESHPEARVSGVHGIDETETVRDYVLRRLADPGLAGVGVDEEMALRFPSRMIWRAPADLLATSRTFLIPEGAPPPPMRECFLTQSAERIQCRRADTGLPVWTIHLRRIPGFLLVPERFGISFPRTGDKLLEGAYSGSSLVLHDHRNLFAVDVEKGAVRWHLPLEEGGISERALSPPTLSERIRGAKIGEDAIFVATSRKKLYRFDLQGEKTWEREIDFNPATSAPLIETGESIFVLGQRPVELREYRKSDGSEIGPLREAFAEGVLQLEPRPVEVAESLLLIAFTSPARTAHIRLVDLRRREMRWELTHARTRVRELFHFPAEPDEAILVLEPESRIPVLVGLSVRSGREIWRYQRFEEADVTLSVARDGDRVYVIHGASAEISTWKLLALQMSRGADRGKLQLVPIWKPKEISLGFSYSSRKRLLITEDSILYPEHATLSVYDKLTGKTRSADQDLLNRFLVEKGSSTTEIIGGRLIILTDGGDCALAAVPDIEDRERSRQRLRLIRDHLRDPSAPGLVAELALDYFRDGDRDGVRSAINVLDRALSSEAVLAAADQETLAGLAFLLDGFKEEAMKVLPEIEIQSRRLWMPPRIDGEMDDSWNLAHQVRLSTPRHIGRIGNPGHEFSWEGEEDLSAILYTGWDDENFYFALDVDDDVLRAYDKEATVWKGDCLLIGVDTEGDGGYQHGPGDQLMTLALTIPKRKQPQEDEDDPLGGGEDDAEAADGDEKPDGQFSVKRRDDDSGAVYEVAIPWRSFAAGSPRGQRPPRGFRFGLSLLLLDDDSGTGATKTLSLNPCHLLPRDQKSFSIWKFLIPQFFPRIVLR